jgi:hypothetical protein
MTTIEIQLLGQFEVTVDDHTVLETAFHRNLRPIAP